MTAHLAAVPDDNYDMTTPVVLESAYRQLAPSERSFVDAAVREIESQAQRAGERITNILNRPLPHIIVSQSKGLLGRGYIRSAITERVLALGAEQELTASRLVKELMSIATANIGNYMTFDDDDAPVFDLSRCTPEQLAAIKSVEVESNGDALSRAAKTKVKIVFHDKIPAIKLAGDYIGLWSGDNPHFKAEQARAADKSALPDTATPEQAADAYQRYLAG